ncbi:uncharacterized protein N7498_003382 [Penicillium cinerascens]|uniref:Transcription factor TFIIIC complex subunit Tfc6 n=1 Tax=Penicillium cinerascens TaxID=70096 RepID=A0A9W9N223_9EURO|nr:uncharacterized protein N7498_003382 [Penicillium cinerascens]KAJ5211736.1 hypothetical protein N7498_003382 [Penicillium cinerascens]
MPLSRRSGRVKSSRTKYTVDPFASAGISDDSDSEKVAKTPKGKARRRAEDSASDEEFVAPGSDEEMNDGPDDGDDDVSEADEEAGDAEMEVEEDVATPKRKEAVARPRFKRRFPNSQVAPSPDDTHFRGIMDPKDHVAKPIHYALTFGDDDRDLLSAIYMRDRWFRGIDACLPTRFALEQSEEPDYGCGPTMGLDPEDFERERTRGWDWYYDKDMGKSFQKKQSLTKLKAADAHRNYFPEPKNGKHTILMGPPNQQTTVNLGYHESFNYGKIWKDIKGRKSDQSTQMQVREGWLINFGQKVQCMAWAPNQDGLSQYMAVVVPISDEQKKIYHPAGSEPLSVFHTSPPYPCTLQLWEFKGKKTGERTNTLDMDFEPRLRLALCSDWGDLRRMAWCPMGREKRSEDEKGDTEHLGLLAGIWSDGTMRVLDIRIHRKSEKAEFLKINSPVFEARPPSTLCSCLTWLSPSDIATLVYARPSGRKHFHAPHANRFPSSQLLTDPLFRLLHGREQLRTDDADPSILCLHHGRESPQYRILSRTVQFLAPLSPVRRIGGEVMATNPFRRLLYNKEQQWQQLWFTHDWAQGPDPASSGVSRFYEGYQAESQSLARNLVGEKKAAQGLSLTTIHDESTHVTSLGWNPSRPCSAWASAALGCGLVRVEDLAI